MLLCGSQSLTCKSVKYVGCKFSVCGKQLGCQTPEDGTCLALRALVVSAEVEDESTIRGVLHVLNDFGTDDAFALISVRQYKRTWTVRRKCGYQMHSG